MRYRLVIFDFDGTLADTLPWFFGVLDEITERFGLRKLEPGEREELRGREPREAIRRLGVPFWKLPAIARAMRDMAARDLESFRLFPGIERAVARIAAAGARVAIVSSNAEENVRRVLGPRVGASIADYACGASLFDKHVKFKRVLKRAGVAREEAIGVGDEIRDIEAARKVGIAAAAVAWGYAHPEALRACGADLFFETVEEMERALAGG